MVRMYVNEERPRALFGAKRLDREGSLSGLGFEAVLDPSGARPALNHPAAAVAQQIDGGPETVLEVPPRSFGRKLKLRAGRRARRRLWAESTPARVHGQHTLPARGERR